MSKAAPPEKTVTVVLRYDDYGPASDTAIERGILESLARHGLSCVFGVVPFTAMDIAVGGQSLCANEEKSTMLRQAVADGVVEAALHGCSHQRLTERGPGSRPTEFAGRGYETQLALILRGRKELEACTGRVPDCFIPPFNSYDVETVWALERVGIGCLSASMFGFAPERTSMRFLPQTCNLTQMRAAVEAARAGTDAKPLVVPLFHEFDFVENSAQRGRMSLGQFDGLLAWLAAQPDVTVRTAAQIQAEGHDLGIERYRAQQRFLMASLHPRAARVVRAEPARLRYLERDRAERLRRAVVRKTAASYALAALCAAGGGVAAVVAGLPKGLLLGLAGGANAAWVAMLLRRKGDIYYNAARLSVFLAALLAGVWAA